MTIASRLYLFAVTGILGLMLLGGTGLYQLSRLNHLVALDMEEFGGDLEVVIELTSARSAFQSQVQEWKNILIRGNRQEDFDKYLKQFGVQEGVVQARLKEAAEIFRKDGEADRAQLVDSLIREHQVLGAKYREALKDYDVNDREAGRKTDQAVKGVDRATTRGLDSLVQKIQKEEMEHMRHQLADVQAGYESSRSILLAIIVAVVAGAGISVFMIVRGIRGSLNQLQQTVETIPRDWNLRQRVPVTGNDEVAATSRSINLMLESFQEVVGRIIANARQTANSCAHMAGSLKQIQQAVTKQNDSTSAMAAAVEELTTSFAQIHNNANESLVATSEARQSALAGDSVIGETSDAMNGIVGSVQGAAAVIERVGAQSNDISAIVQVIREVADQTNLLALNAAIEAARAGEQGRGFAVVADEVRKLAEKTTSSAEEIRRMIEAVQQSSGQAVDDIRSVVEQVQAISEKSERARSAMADIRSQTERSEGYSRDITYALGEQSSASTLIAQNVETVARMSEENNGHVSRAEQAMGELEGESQALQQAVARFSV